MANNVTLIVAFSIIIRFSIAMKTKEQLRTLIDKHQYTKRLPVHELCSYRSSSIKHVNPDLSPDVSNMMFEGSVVANAKPLGVGGFGTVFGGKFKEKDVAVKILHRSEDYDRLTEKEVYVWLALFIKAQEDVPTFFDCYYDEWHTYLIMARMDSDLKKLASSMIWGQKTFPESDLINIAIAMTEKVENMHKASFVHFDIKPENFLVSIVNNKGKNEYIVNINDFGLSRPTSEDVISCGTRLFMSPELINRPGSKEPTDIYALGVSIMNLYTRNIYIPEGCYRAYSDECHKTMMHRLCSVFESNCSVDAGLSKKIATINSMHSLLAQMLAKNPDDRITAAGAIKALKELKEKAKDSKKAVSPPNSVSAGNSSKMAPIDEAALEALEERICIRVERPEDNIDSILKIIEQKVLV